MVCRVFLIRHGETLWNKDMRFQGHMDIPLSEKGLEQAKALSCRLSGKKISAVYSSDLIRAVDTAHLVAEPHGLEVTKVSALREINFGDWEGLTYNEIRERYGELINNWWKNPLKTNIPGGEGLSDLVNRLVPATREIIERHMGEQVAIVCHGGPVKTLIGLTLDMDLNKYWKISQYNTALNILEFPDWENGLVVLLNDHNHLSEDPELTHWTKKIAERSK